MPIAWLMGYLATSIGIGAGGGIAWILKGSRKRIGFIYSLCGGMMIGLLGLEIVPEAVMLGGWRIAVPGFVGGMMFIKMVHPVFHRADIEKEAYMYTGMLILLGVSLHNFPMGIVLEMTAHSLEGMPIHLAMILHNVPEGIILFTPLLIGGIRGNQILMISALVGLPVVIGALFGSILDPGDYLLPALFLSFTAGNMLMITVDEMFSKAIQLSSLSQCAKAALIGAAFIHVYFWVI